MEPSKGNTVGLVKSSPSLRTTRKTLKFFKVCSGFFFSKKGKGYIINQTFHGYLSYPWLYLRIKPTTQSQQGKK